MYLLLKSELTYSNPYKNAGEVKRCTILIFHMITLDPVSGCAYHIFHLTRSLVSIWSCIKFAREILELCITC